MTLTSLPLLLLTTLLLVKFSQFVSDTIKWLSAGFIAVWGPVDLVDSPYLVLPLTVKPTKP